MHGFVDDRSERLLPGIEAAIDVGVRAIPPLWPLASSVAVNPYLGQAAEPLEVAAVRLARAAGAPVTMPRRWYAERLADGRIDDRDLGAALTASRWPGKPTNVATLKGELGVHQLAPRPVPTVADLAAAVSGIDWPGIVADRIGHWAAGYFDEGQALWRAHRDRGAYASWRETALHDLTPETLGLPGFARFVAAAPETARGALARSVATLDVGDEAFAGLFTRALTTLGGWAQCARFRHFEAELAGTGDDTALDLLAIRLVWEEALFTRYRDAIEADWRAACVAHAAPLTPSHDQHLDAILQHAAELGGQRDLIHRLSSADPVPVTEPPIIQAAFCIDVRSEVFRRALEATDPRVRTLGFAGFFGLAAAHRRFASDVVERRLPVLLNPAVTSIAGSSADANADLARRAVARAARAWGRFKLAAVSSFAFVEAAGPVYLLKLMRDALGAAAAKSDDPPPQLDPPLSVQAQVDAAETILRAMSLAQGFARLVLIVGHGAQVANNPHASALQCGACGGFSGEVNARLLAGLLNTAPVRSGLAKRGILIADTTRFVAALHDTTADIVTLYVADQDLTQHRDDLTHAQTLLQRAGRTARAERAPRLPHAGGEATVLARARDWAETRPEWGLAGARAFIAAPRERTAGRSFAGQAFLHDYDWRADPGFAVLELILTAPVVVASWISLQYYGSAVAPALFGGGNKLLHNVTGGMGVVEGNGGLLRGGLPWQSVHDGRALMHDPLRLTVCVEAPRGAIEDILARHDHVRALFDNRWLHLLLLDDGGKVAWRYIAMADWQAIVADRTEVFA